MVSGSPTNTDIITQQYLGQVGVQVKFNQVESVVLTTARTNKTFKHSIIGTPQTGYDPVKVAQEWFLPDSPRNWGGVDDPVMTDLVQKATYALDAAEQQRLIEQIHERDMDQAYRLQRYVAFAVFMRQPWVRNVASATQGYSTPGATIRSASHGSTIRRRRDARDG
jgi:ABC-type transport system substrate-binding protein